MYVEGGFASNPTYGRAARLPGAAQTPKIGLAGPKISFTIIYHVKSNCRQSSILGVWAAPGGRETHPKKWRGSPPQLLRGSFDFPGPTRPPESAMPAQRFVGKNVKLQAVIDFGCRAGLGWAGLFEGADLRELLVWAGPVYRRCTEGRVTSSTGE